MTLDFSPAAAHRFPVPPTGAPVTSTDLARSYGLDGEWTVRPGAELVVDLLNSVRRPWWSRMVQPAFGTTWHASQVEVIPAVGGRTIWPPGRAPAVLVETPNWVGAPEDLDEAATHGPLALLMRPVLAGDLGLPPATAAVMLDLGADAVSIAPGPDVPLEGRIAAWAAVDHEQRRSLAEAATMWARRLAKKLNQLPSVSAPLGRPRSGWFVVTTPRDPAAVLAAMAVEGVQGGAPVGLPEHPGGIALVCHPEHTDGDLDRYVDVMASALA